MSLANMPGATPDRGTLANNYMFVRGLQSALSVSETNKNAVLAALKRVMLEDCWRHWLTAEGKEFRWNAADFRRFIESPRPTGCQVEISFVRGMLRDTPLAEPFEDLIRGEPGGNNNPYGRAGKPDEVINRDIVTVDYDPSIIPFAPSPPEPHARDYDREAPTGNSVSYALRRLKTQRPDLHEKVQAKKLSPNAAMVEAGFRKPTISLPVDPDAAVRLIVKHFQGDALTGLIDGLVNWSGYTPNSMTEQESR